ncbi:hypothetical protein JCM19236_6646 [Vibrio sp. JCM 19236]|nr:hypothetical protein JCM19236_6646 [Vibrio sp. JCM 19236]
MNGDQVSETLIKYEAYVGNLDFGVKGRVTDWVLKEQNFPLFLALVARCQSSLVLLSFWVT